jgi:nicotinate dehydrogenase subunit B
MSAKREVLAKDAASASVRAGACPSRRLHDHNIFARQYPLPTGITRREFVKIGGALFVSLSLPTKFLARANASSSETTAASPDATQLASWLEIRSDNSIVARTGRTDTGTGMSAYYAQTIAEELNVRPESISLITGDTDKTPDGGYSAGFLTGMSNLRKVSAYTYQALLALAATRLGVPISALSVVNGAVSGGRKSITYGELVAGQQLHLKIPVSGSLAKPDPSQWVGVTTLDGLTVTGDPPAKPIAQYQVIGTSYPMPAVRDKVIGKTQWSCDVTLPGMLHARMIRPATLGSKLISVGALDKKQFPTAEIVTKANLVAVVSPDEWEAASAARAVAATTKWTDWSGLPGSENVIPALRKFPWDKPAQTHGESAAINAALTAAPKTISATYDQGYVRHAPIGPFVAVADVHLDATTTIWTHSAQSQGLRARMSELLGVPTEKIVVRWLDHSGQYGRTTFGGDGADADAVILSLLTHKPVRVQWTLQEDLAWSSVSPAWVSDLKAACNSRGHITALLSEQYSPNMTDPRPLGALLAGMPCSTSPPGNWIATEWVYDKINRFEAAYGMPNLAADAVSGGLRGNIMRTPGQRQQNFALECLINEAAAAAKIDPVEFRLAHTTDARMIDILNATAKAAGWQPRPSPQESARKSGDTALNGRGVCIMRRANAYWVGIAEIAITPATGAITVTKFTIGAEVGKVINPRQLNLCMKSGVVMGLSETLKEEVTFDDSKITSTNWDRYKILTMEETPDIQVVQLSRDDKGFGGGSEAANAIVAPALAAAVHDATTVHPRRLPLTPTYITTLLKS